MATFFRIRPQKEMAAAIRGLAIEIARFARAAEDGRIVDRAAIDDFWDRMGHLSQEVLQWRKKFIRECVEKTEEESPISSRIIHLDEHPGPF